MSETADQIASISPTPRAEAEDVLEYRPSAPDGPRLSWWEYVSFTLSHTLAAGLLMVLRPRGLYAFARFFGTLEWLINHKRRRRFRRALKRVMGADFPPAERRRATREFFMRTRCDKIFYLIFDSLPRDRAQTLLTIDRQDLLDEAVARGRGVYVAMSHHGAHHVIAMLMALRGYQIAGVRDRNEGALRRYVQDRFDRRYPEFQRMRVLFSDAYPRDIYRCLKDGYLLGSAMDVSRVRHATQKAEEIEVFGEKRPFLTGPLRVALRCKAPILQAFVLPDPNFGYRLHIVGRLLDPDQVSDESEAVAEAARTYAANVEQYVRQYPSLITRI